jgi:hypothetical protein
MIVEDYQNDTNAATLYTRLFLQRELGKTFSACPLPWRD